jgi:hypothetical protein
MDLAMEIAEEFSEKVMLLTKFLLCVLCTQFGKTFTAINRILLEISLDPENGKSIHVVHTMNTLDNNDQFTMRFKPVAELHGPHSVVVVSSKKPEKGDDTWYTHVTSREQLQGLCLDPRTCPHVVVMCSNKKRFDDAFEFIKVINDHLPTIRRVFMYFDELHEYINPTLRAQLEEAHDLDKVKGILVLTATPHKIFADGFWSKFRTLPLDDLNYENYAGWDDMAFHCIDDFFATPYIRTRNLAELERQTIRFIEHVLEKHPYILDENTRTFIPGHVRRTSHNAVRELVFRRNPNATVVVLNGKEKTLQFKDTRGNTITLPIKGKGELCERIATLVLKHELQSRPLVITGFLCVGMGQTFTNEKLGSFTSAIIGHMDLSSDALYQLIGRIMGRMKHWDTYVQTNVYCPSDTMDRCHVMEKCARNMAAEHSGEVVDRETYLKPAHDMGEAGKLTLASFSGETPKREKKQPSTLAKMTPLCSLPTEIINLDDAQNTRAAGCYRRRPELWKLIREIQPETYAQYYPAFNGITDGTCHAWKITTRDIFNKWTINRLLTDSTYQASTNIKEEKREHLKDVIFIYYSDGTFTGGRKCLILKPWNGTAWSSSDTGTGAGTGAGAGAAVPDDGRAAGGAGAS